MKNAGYSFPPGRLPGGECDVVPSRRLHSLPPSPALLLNPTITSFRFAAKKDVARV